MGLNYDYDETYLKPGRTEHFTEGRSFIPVGNEPRGRA